MARVLLVSPGHSPDRTSRQPWAYIEGIATELSKQGHTTRVVGDGSIGQEEAPLSGFEQTDSVTDTAAIESVADRFRADTCIWSLGPTTSLRVGRTLPEVAEKMIALIPGPVYSPLEIASQLAITDFREAPDYASLVASSLVPRRWFSSFLRRNFDKVIAPTSTALEALSLTERTDSFPVPHGRDTGLLASESNGSTFRKDTPEPPEKTYLLNFGPPRPIRGATDFVDAVIRLRNQGIDLKGVMLARIDDATDREKLDDIKRHVEDRNAEDGLQFVDRYLTEAELIEYIEGASTVALPYRIVQSTVPISIIEALGLGTPVVTTEVQGARELLPDSSWAVPTKDPVSLASVLGSLLESERNQPQNFVSRVPTWEESVQPLLDEIKRPT